MILHEHIKFYHGGNVAQFSKSIGETPQLVAHWLANGGYTVEKKRIVKVMRNLPKTELDHIKKVQGDS